MPKHKPFLSISLLLKILITACAYIYIYYRIDDSIYQNQVFDLSLPLSHEKTILISVTLILMFFNWLIESYKWKKLLTVVEKTSIQKSIKSVLVGITCSVFTPYRIGEYFGRPILIKKQKRTEAAMANFLGSISQNIVTFGLGIIGTSLLILNHPQNLSYSSKILVLLALICLCIILVIFYFSPSSLIKLVQHVRPFRKYHEKLKFLKKYTKRDMLKILLLSLSRYLVFFSQYYLLLVFFDIDIRLIDAFTSISLSYVFLFSIPGIPIAEIGIRGSLALFFLGIYSSNNLAIVSASSALWIINLALPSIIGSYFLIKNKNAAD